MSLFGIQKKWKNSIIKSNFSKTKGLQLLILSIVFASCSPKSKSAYQNYESDVYQTSYAGDNLKLLTNDEVKTTSADVKKVSLELLPDKEFQKYYGFGASFTESSAWNLATIPVESRKEVLTKLFSQSL